MSPHLPLSANKTQRDPRLTGGSVQVAGVVFHVAKANFLPRQQSDKTFRWEYDFAEVGEDPTRKGYALADLGPGSHHDDADEWTIGSSSSVSSGSISPVDENQSLWEGETLASHSDVETGR